MFKKLIIKIEKQFIIIKTSYTYYNKMKKCEYIIYTLFNILEVDFSFLFFIDNICYLKKEKLVLQF